MGKQLIPCSNPKCDNEIATDKEDGYVQCGKILSNGKKCGTRTEI